MTKKEKKELIENIYVLKLQDDATAEIDPKLLKSVITDTVNEVTNVAYIALKPNF